MNQEIRNTLEQLKNGEISVDEAMLSIKKQPFEELGYAKVDLHREVRQGAAEVIYGAGKTGEQIIGIAESMRRHGQKTILITRLEEEKARKVQEKLPMRYEACARIGIVGEIPRPDGLGRIVVATGGTSDIPVADCCGRASEGRGRGRKTD